MTTLLGKILVIVLVVMVADEVQSQTFWCFVAVPLIYLSWRLEPSKG